VTISILAFDPGRYAGWALLEGGHLTAHGTADNGAGHMRATESFAAARRGIATTIPDVVAVELPFIPRGKDGRKASAGSVYARHGYLVGASMSRWHTARIWEPNASEWRSVLGLNKGGQKRADVNSRVMLWALETVRGARTREGQAFPLRRANRERGEELFDEANAIALAFAALARFRFSLAPPPPP